MSAPKRIQRKRTKGWRMPEGAVYVGRPSRWGNPWRVSEDFWGRWLVRNTEHEYQFLADDFATTEEALAASVEAYRGEYPPLPGFAEAVRAELGGKDLACWCPLDQPCHADVLLEIANDGAA